MRIAERWTVQKRNKTGKNRKPWVVYPPGFKIGGFVHLHRRFETWDEAIDYVFDEGIKMRRRRSNITLLRCSDSGVATYTLPNMAPGTVVRIRVHGEDVAVEPWHGQAAGQAS